MNISNRNTLHLGYFLAAVVVLHVMFLDSILKMVSRWESPEYGHGYFIPIITAYLAWKVRDRFFDTPVEKTLPGVFIMIAALFIGLAGELGTLYVVVQYAYLLALYGLVISFVGWSRFKIILVPLLFLLVMIPLPGFLYNNLSAELQLISSKIGVAIIRLMGISVFLEGNVIDLGTYKLQVVEACSGLKYLFSLTSIGFICAYLFKDTLLKRAIIFLSTIPITVFMNSFRIGVTGALVEHWGIEHAEGFLHEFEGLVIFGAALVILMIEMAILARIGKNKGTLADKFQDRVVEKGSFKVANAPTRGFAVAVVLLAAASIGFSYVGERQEIVPDRATFSKFPDALGDWKGKKSSLEQIYLDTLKLTDYLLSSYRNSSGDSVELYIAYYGSQRKGESIHSPKSCLPGGGWQIPSHKIVSIDLGNGKAVRVNRVHIRKGSYSSLVYYWFKQRDRNMTNEYLVKWYLVVDAVTRNRTDGALVRLTATVRNADLKAADRLLTDMMKKIGPVLPQYIPD